MTALNQLTLTMSVETTMWSVTEAKVSAAVAALDAVRKAGEARYGTWASRVERKAAFEAEGSKEAMELCIEAFVALTRLAETLTDAEEKTRLADLPVRIVLPSLPFLFLDLQPIELIDAVTAFCDAAMRIPGEKDGRLSTEVYNLSMVFIQGELF